ncbi:MAG: phosphoribosylglycinamide formyltransferase [Alphaproteobacteria bacterium]
MAELKLAVLISGRGSNLQSLIDASADTDFPAKIVLVVSNVPGVQGLDKAAAAGIESQVVDHKDYDGREAFEEALQETIAASGADLICLAGFMRILGGDFVGKWPDRMINIHPSLLPDFKGLHVHERVIEAGEKQSGCTVHFVIPDLDSGPIIVQATVPVEPGDSADTLAARVLTEEHRIFPEAVRMIAEGRVAPQD